VRRGVLVRLSRRCACSSIAVLMLVLGTFAPLALSFFPSLIFSWRKLLFKRILTNPKADLDLLEHAEDLRDGEPFPSRYFGVRSLPPFSFILSFFYFVFIFIFIRFLALFLLRRERSRAEQERGGDPGVGVGAAGRHPSCLCPCPSSRDSFLSPSGVHGG
jgi:hypothetical protein